MSNNDSIKRGEVLREIKEFIYHNTALIDNFVANGIVDIVEGISAVPHEMSAREYHLIKRRMCKNCPVCPLNEAAINLFIDCKRFEREYPEKAVGLVKNWAREHPEERSEE